MTTRTIEGENLTLTLEDQSLYDGVRTRRVLAFCIDYFFIGLLMIPVAIVIAVLGVVTLGLGWFLYAILFPLVALPYIWMTLGGEKQATPGMQLTSVRLERLDGGSVDGMLAVVHSVLFWAANAILTPLILLVTLFTDRKRTLHDLLLGTVVTRSDR